jgi:hypothetical protein
MTRFRQRPNGVYERVDTLPYLSTVNVGGYAIGQETNEHNLGLSLALRRVVEKNLPFHLSSQYTTDVAEYPEGLWPEHLVYHAEYDAKPTSITRTWESDDWVVQIYHPMQSRNNVDVDVWATNIGVAKELLRQWKSIVIPSKKKREINKIDLTFWMMGGQGPKNVRRSIEVPSWESIKNNYNGPVAKELDDMMYRFQPSRGGQLILWHGEPGTGKTYSLRALGREWRKWCDMHYIMDPERFFGHDADYLMSVLLDNRHVLLDDDEENDPDFKEGDDRWRLLIFEDTGELMSADAGERAGQGLSRFLNTVDGLIGQGLKVLLLVTTNQELGKLHPAVARSGRSSVNLEFQNLNAAESLMWAERNGITVEPHGHSLADLYAALMGHRKEPERVPVGFARR